MIENLYTYGCAIPLCYELLFFNLRRTEWLLDLYLTRLDSIYMTNVPVLLNGAISHTCIIIFLYIANKVSMQCRGGVGR